MSEGLVTVVTPFYNTAPFLAECIESVLAQTHTRFEYILVDNCSTDGSSEIADHFARRDSRIRLIRRTNLLSQVQNYNRALGEMSEASRYCKFVQADDFIFPDCLRLMVELFEKSESVGLVSSYWLKGNDLRGSGFPYPSPVLSGKEMARLYLRKGVWVFGSPTAVMYRSTLIKRGEPFYDESKLHEDSDKCFEILNDWDFGFVHQVLSFSRSDNISISSAVSDLQPVALNRYLLVQQYASVFLPSLEATALKRQAKRDYYKVLARQAIQGPAPEFWSYHRRGLSTADEKVDSRYLALQVGTEVLRLAGNPGSTARRVLRFAKRKLSRQPLKDPASRVRIR